MAVKRIKGRAPVDRGSMSIKYAFRAGEPLRIKAAEQADPQVFGEALDALSKQHGGKLSPRDVVDAARNKAHPLHKHFEWDDALAAAAHRIEQARSIIRVVRVVDSSFDEGSVRAFLSVSEKTGVAYHPIDSVRSSAALQVAVLDQAQRDLDAFDRRYNDLLDLFEEVKSLRDKIGAKRREHEESRAAH